MKILARAAFLALTTAAFPALARDAEPRLAQTIVMIRHAERAEGGLGQLSCQGLNRALALPERLAKRFGRPDYLFAPDPGFEKEDLGRTYSYVRPLATIEPTAIMFGLPVDATIGFADVEKLERRLQKPAYSNATVVLAWEHHQIVALARDLLGARAGAAVPDWHREDFDGIFVVRIKRDGSATTRTFERVTQDLDGLPTACPGAGSAGR